MNSVQITSFEQAEEDFCAEVDALGPVVIGKLVLQRSSILRDMAPETYASMLEQFLNARGVELD